MKTTGKLALLVTLTMLLAVPALAQDYAFSYYYPGTPGAVISQNTLYGFHSLIENTGAQPDSYNVHIEKFVPPANWTTTVCHGTFCYPPWITDFTIEMDPGQQDELLVDFQWVNNHYGFGMTTLTVRSLGSPGLPEQSVTFLAIARGTPIIIVDDDGGADYETYYQAALELMGEPYGLWDVDLIGKADAAILDYFQAVVWPTGSAVPTVDADDRTALSTYLTGGGNLFISGQDIGYDLNDPGSGNYSPEAVAWYQSYLGASYVSDDSADLTINGIGGDPIGDGLSFGISGGTGANNQDSPSEIEPLGGGVACFDYSAGVEAGVHLSTGTFRSVYLAFGFEGIAEEIDRFTVMTRVLDWMALPTAVPGEGPVQPVLVSLPEATPNPFNPTTHIKFDIGGHGNVPVEVSIFNLRGHLVRNLWNGTVQPGPQDFVWNGRSDSGQSLASGVYVARVNVNGQPQTVKMTLTK